MRNRLYDYICVLVLLEILRPSSHCATVGNVTRRAKREINVAEASRSRGSAREVHGANFERDGIIDGDLEEAKASRRSADVQRSSVEGSVDAAGRLDSREESDYAGEADGNEGTSDRVRLTRDVNADLDKYVDQDERASLYDDYEAKDVAKRGVPDGPGDYEEMEDDSPAVLDDTAAMREPTISEAELRETRVKRDQAISVALDKSKSNPDEGTELGMPRIAASEGPHSRQIPRGESPENFAESGSKAISGPSDSTEIKVPTSVAASSGKDDDGSRVRYERRAEDEIQRRIDSIKEEIKRDVEARRRVRNIRADNARFDELREREREADRDGGIVGGETIEKRQAKRSVERSSSAETRLRRRSGSIGESDNPKGSEDPKGRFAADRDKRFASVPTSPRLFEKKRERARQAFLVNDGDRARSYGPEAGPLVDSDSYLRADDGTLQAPPSPGEDGGNGAVRNRATAESPDSSASLGGSSQELSPRLAREYKEAFGGLQSVPGGALARFKRIKRALVGDGGAKFPSASDEA